MKVPKNLEMEDFMDMTVSLPKHPHEPGRGTEHPSDHYQVLLTPSPATLGKGARFAIPVWLVRKPAFAHRVKERWKQIESKEGGGERSSRRRKKLTKKAPFRRLKRFDETMVSVAKAMMKGGTGKTEDSVSALALALSQLRKLKARETTEREARSRCGENSNLEKWLTNRGRGSLQESLQDYVQQKTEQRVKERVTEVWRRKTSAYSEQVSESIPIQHEDRTDYIRSQKRALEPSKSHLPYLVEEDEYVTEWRGC